MTGGRAPRDLGVAYDDLPVGPEHRYVGAVSMYLPGDAVRVRALAQRVPVVPAGRRAGTSRARWQSP